LREKQRQDKVKEDERLEKLRLFEMEQKPKEDERLEKTRLFEMERAKLELEREEKARQEKERERQFEFDKQEREMQMEHEKHKQEMEKLDFQAKIREQEAGTTEEGRRQSEGNGDGVLIGRAVGKVTKMPYFDEERDFMDNYLGQFERFAETQKWKHEHWAMYLSAL